MAFLFTGASMPQWKSRLRRISALAACLAGRVDGSEGSFQNPMFAAQLFQAKALVLMDDVKELKKKRPWIDEFATQPWYRGIRGRRNPVILIKRHGTTSWRWHLHRMSFCPEAISRTSGSLLLLWLSMTFGCLQ